MNYNKEEVMKSLCKYFDWDEDSEQASSVSTALDAAYKAGKEEQDKEMEKDKYDEAIKMVQVPHIK